MSFVTSSPCTNLAELRVSGWQSKSVKQEIHDNLLTKLQAGEELFSRIIGYQDTVLPEINIAILAQQELFPSEPKRKRKDSGKPKPTPNPPRGSP